MNNYNDFKYFPETFYSVIFHVLVVTSHMLIYISNELIYQFGWGTFSNITRNMLEFTLVSVLR